MGRILGALPSESMASSILKAERAKALHTVNEAQHYWSDIARWPGVVRELEGAALKSMQDFFSSRCTEYAHRYDFEVSLERAFSVHCSSLEEQFANYCKVHHDKKKVSNRSLLLHGTVRENAKSILQGGFRIPDYSGMFGRGIYFSNTPLKSKQYCGWLGCLVLCEVELGNSKIERSSRKDLIPEIHLGRSATNGDQLYDSITAKDGPDGCV